MALVFSLAGDVFLLDGDRRFIPGLVAFLLAHVAYTIGLIVAPDWSWVGFGVGVAVTVVLATTVGLRIVRAARRSEPVLGPAVSAYLVAISLMFCAAVAFGNWWAIAGAGLFVDLRFRARLAPIRRLGPLDARHCDGHVSPRPGRPRREPPLIRPRPGAMRLWREG